MRAYIALAAIAAVVVLGFADLASASATKYRVDAVKTDLNQFFNAGSQEIRNIAYKLYKQAEDEGTLSQATFGVAAQLVRSIGNIYHRTLKEAIEKVNGVDFDHELSELQLTAEEINEKLDGRLQDMLKISKTDMPMSNFIMIVADTAKVAKIVRVTLEHIATVAAQGSKYADNSIGGEPQAR